MIRLATVFSGIGAVEQALEKDKIDYEIVFACDNGERELEETKEEILEKTKGYTLDKREQYVNDLYNKLSKPNYMEMSYKENYPSKLLEDAVGAISSLPGVGKRSALRLALHLLRQPQENVAHFTSAISRLRNEVRYCSTCMMISDEETCSICSDVSRDRRTICVVENVRDVMSIEGTGQFHGVYHVLGGIISPINGIGPSDLNIKQLVSHVEALSLDGAPFEIILALSGDVEGETTSFYIYRQISRFNPVVSTLARGLGFGDDLEYADQLTLGRSIANRQAFKP